MMMDRRAFVAGVALTAIAPVPDVSARPASAPVAEASRVAFMIDGWSVRDGDANADEIWITIDRGWRAAWR